MVNGECTVEIMDHSHRRSKTLNSMKCSEFLKEMKTVSSQGGFAL
jgi:hypothetical protein